uniref:Cystatin domain-containing protein n=1 Tax=Monodon monoceros TaxID=40151 RepID=A0A8C6BMY7_MONMO
TQKPEWEERLTGRDRDQTLGVLVDSTFLSKNPGKVLRESRTISTSSGNVKQCLWFAEYNKASKDEYTFKVLQILKSQEQVTDSLDYLLEVKIARTMCKKASGGNENCLVQRDPRMQKVGAKIEFNSLGWSCSKSPVTLQGFLPVSALAWIMELLEIPHF